MNKYKFLTGLCYGVSTPIGVHIGFLMGQGQWTQAILETLVLMVIHMLAPNFWIKAQTIDIKDRRRRKR